LLTCDFHEPKTCSAAALPTTNAPNNIAPQPAKTDNTLNKPEVTSQDKTHSNNELYSTLYCNLFSSSNNTEKRSARPLDIRINQYAERERKAELALACPVELENNKMVMTFKDSSVAKNFHETYFKSIAASVLSGNKITLTGESEILNFITQKLKFANYNVRALKNDYPEFGMPQPVTMDIARVPQNT